MSSLHVPTRQLTASAMSLHKHPQKLDIVPEKHSTKTEPWDLHHDFLLFCSVLLPPPTCAKKHGNEPKQGAQAIRQLARLRASRPPRRCQSAHRVCLKISDFEASGPFKTHSKPPRLQPTLVCYSWLIGAGTKGNQPVGAPSPTHLKTHVFAPRL